MNLPEAVYDRSVLDPLGLAVPFLDREPRWLILGGLGNCDDVGPALRRWPNARVVGVDPDPRAVNWQLEHSWPKGPQHLLLEMALSDAVGTAAINPSTICCASLHPDMLALAGTDELTKVQTTTLDVLERQFGPFEDSILWLDLEGWEPWALEGGRELLASDRVMLLCVEVRYENVADSCRASAFLDGLGWQRVWVWFRQWWGHNEFWMRRP